MRHSPAHRSRPRASRRQRRGLFEALESRLLLSVFNPATAAAFTAALSDAELGDTIILNAGTTYVGQFTLPNKTTGSGWITIQSSRLAELPGEGVRVTPADAVNMARLQSQGGNAPVVQTPPGVPAHHYAFVGIEFVGPANNTNLTVLVALGTDQASQSTVESIPHHLVIDRCYLHPNVPTAHVRRAIALNSASTDIINSYIEEIHEPGSDSQAIAGWNGIGPFNIINNRLEGASENIMFGGATNRIPGHVSADIVVRGNHIIKPLHWRELNYNVKNLFELKHGSNVLVEDNILENCWTQGQTGVAIVLKLGDWGVSPQNVTEDVIFRNNIIRNANGAVALQGRDYASNSPEGLVRRLTFTNNLFDNINGYWGTSRTGGGNFNIYITHGPKDVTFDHNTFINGYTAIEVDENSATYENDNFKFTNNIVDHNAYGVRSPAGIGNSTFDAYLSAGDYEFTKNVLVNTPYGYRNAYTHRPGNYLLYQSGDPDLWASVGFVDMAAHNYRLDPTSPYKNAGTDGKDVGADIDVLEAAVAGVANGVFLGVSGADDHFTIRRVGPGGARIEVDNAAWPAPPALPAVPFVDNFAYYQSFVFKTGDGVDRLTFDYVGGPPVPGGTTASGVVLRGAYFDGGAGADALNIIGDGTSARYTPHAAIFGNGTVTAGGDIAFVGAEALSGSGLAGFTLITPNADDDIAIDSPESGIFRASGTSGGVAFAPLSLSGAVALTLDTAAGDAGGGHDVITVAAGANPITRLAVNVGTGSNTLNVNSGSFTLDTNLGIGGVNLDVVVNNADTQVWLVPGRLDSLSINGGRVTVQSNQTQVVNVLSINLGDTTRPPEAGNEEPPGEPVGEPASEPVIASQEAAGLSVVTTDTSATGDPTRGANEEDGSALLALLWARTSEGGTFESLLDGVPRRGQPRPPVPEVPLAQPRAASPVAARADLPSLRRQAISLPSPVLGEWSWLGELARHVARAPARRPFPAAAAVDHVLSDVWTWTENATSLR